METDFLRPDYILPLQAKQDKMDKYKTLADSTKLHPNPVHAAMIGHIDNAVKALSDALRNKGTYDNTIFV